MYRLLIISVSLSLSGCATGNCRLSIPIMPFHCAPDIRHFTLDNGLNVHLLQRPQTGLKCVYWEKWLGTRR